MTIIAAALVAALLPAALGGRLHRLGFVSLRLSRLLVLALVARFVALAVLPGPGTLQAAVHVGSYVVAGLFLLGNRRLPGCWLVAAGAACNGIAVALNGGSRPVTPNTLETAGIEASDRIPGSAVVEHPRLPFLGDVFAVPDSWPVASVFSVGDLLIVLGIAVMSWRICGNRWSLPWDAARAGHAVGVPVVPARQPRHATAPLRQRPPSRRPATGQPSPPQPATPWPQVGQQPEPAGRRSGGRAAESPRMLVRGRMPVTAARPRRDHPARGGSGSSMFRR